MSTLLPPKSEIIKTRGKILTPEHLQIIGLRNEQIASMKLNGKPYAQIAKKFRLSRDYIKTICHRFGIKGSADIHGLFSGMRPSPKGYQRVRQRTSHEDRMIE